MSDKPGFMVYFDCWRGIRELDAETKAAFLDAAYDYAKDGVVPDFTGLLAAAWAPIQAGLDRDAEAYQRRVNSGGYAAYCRIEREAGRTPLSYSAWIERSSSIDVERDRSLPTPNTTPIPNTTPATPTSPVTETSTPTHPSPTQSQGERQERGCGGEPVSNIVTILPVNPELSEQDFEQKRGDAIKMLQRAALGR